MSCQHAVVLCSRLLHIRCFTVSRENRSQLAIADDSIFYVNPSPDPSFGYEKIIPCLRCHPWCHLGKRRSISRLQLFTAARLEFSGRRPCFCTKPRLSNDRSLAIIGAAVESDRL